MNSNYTTYKRDGKYFVGVYCLNGEIFACTKKREERGQAVKDAAEARREKIQKKEKPKSALKPLTRKTAKTAPVSAVA
jgi:hypothetical protein